MELVPIFGVIEDVMVFDVDVCYLACEVLITDCFVNHFHAYQVYRQQPQQYFFCKQKNLFDHTVLAAYEITSHPHFMSQ